MTDDPRPHPDAILAGLREGTRAGRGRLTVFLGMCPGVGKTYTMLQAASQRLCEGVNIVVGVVETHRRAETEALLAGLPIVPKRAVDYKGVELEEMDLDAILNLHPELVLVDELAHTNVPGSRHPKRYQDVLELLDAGISVYTTVNVQHIESRVDVVRQITGVTVRETVPDSALDRADEIQLVDLTPEQLRQRLEDGKVYLGEMAQAASENFFKLENLAALREMALRFAAERADEAMRGAMRERRISGPWKSGERLLVAISHDAQAESLIRWTRRVAGELNCPWVAVYVEPNTPVAGAAKERLMRNMSLARQLGGEVVVTSGQNVSEALLRVAREHNATQIVVGKPTRPRWQHWLTGQSPAYNLIRNSGYIDIYVVQPEKRSPAEAPAGRAFSTGARAAEFLSAALVTLIVTGVCILLEPFIGYRAIALVYLLQVVAMSFKFRRGPVLMVAAVSAFLWNFLFIPPVFTLYIDTFHDAMMFAILFIVALAMGHFTSRLRQSEEAERRREHRTAALYDLVHQAALAPDLDTGLSAALKLTDTIFGVESALLLRLPDHTLSGRPHRASSFDLSEKEKSVAVWSFGHRTPAGKFTDTLPDSEALHLPLQARTAVMGVLSIRPQAGKTFDLGERELLEAFAALIGTILEKDHFIEAFKHAEIIETSQRLYRALFDSVSHELKTPLAAVQAGLDGLERQIGADNRPAATLAEIRSAVRRLRRVIDNLLDMTRIEAGVIEPKLDWCDIGELVHEAIALAGEALAAHTIEVESADGLPMVKLDQPLMEQALSNILLNAAAWSGAGTTILIRARLKEDRLMISVLDQGPGLNNGDLQRVFEKFYRAPGARTGGTGLGLSIVEGFVRAHGGTVRAANRPAGGAEFTLEIPVETMRAELGELA